MVLCHVPALRLAHAHATLCVSCLQTLKKLFETKYFNVNLLPDVAGAEMCGTLKNIVAVAAGMVDGLGLGPNSKATIMRQVCGPCLVLGIHSYIAAAADSVRLVL